MRRRQARVVVRQAQNLPKLVKGAPLSVKSPRDGGP